jgi:hypothetical protein
MYPGLPRNVGVSDWDLRRIEVHQVLRNRCGTGAGTWINGVTPPLEIDGNDHG